MTKTQGTFFRRFCQRLITIIIINSNSNSGELSTSTQSNNYSGCDISDCFCLRSNKTSRSKQYFSPVCINRNRLWYYLWLEVTWMAGVPTPFLHTHINTHTHHVSAATIYRCWQNLRPLKLQVNCFHLLFKTKSPNCVYFTHGGWL